MSRITWLHTHCAAAGLLCACRGGLAAQYEATYPLRFGGLAVQYEATCLLRLGGLAAEYEATCLLRLGWLAAQYEATRLLRFGGLAAQYEATHMLRPAGLLPSMRLRACCAVLWRACCPKQYEATCLLRAPRPACCRIRGHVPAAFRRACFFFVCLRIIGLLTFVLLRFFWWPCRPLWNSPRAYIACHGRRYSGIRMPPSRGLRITYHDPVAPPC